MKSTNYEASHYAVFFSFLLLPVFPTTNNTKTAAVWTYHDGGHRCNTTTICNSHFVSSYPGATLQKFVKVRQSLVNTCFLIFIYGCLPLIQNWNLQQMSFNIIRGSKNRFSSHTYSGSFIVRIMMGSTCTVQYPRHFHTFSHHIIWFLLPFTLTQNCWIIIIMSGMSQKNHNGNNVTFVVKNIQKNYMVAIRTCEPKNGCELGKSYWCTAVIERHFF